MTDEIRLDSETIEEHYNALVSSTDGTATMDVTEDTYTNIQVKTDIASAFEYAIELENEVKTCIQNDSENLNQLGAEFIGIDANISDKINAMMEY